MRDYIRLNFKQKPAFDKGLTLSHIVLVQHLIDMIKSGTCTTKIIDNEIHGFFTYRSLLDNYPILKLTNVKSIKNMIDKLCEVGIVKKFKYSNQSTKNMFSVNADILMGSADDYYTTHQGRDTSLIYYMPRNMTRNVFYSTIKIREKTYKYKTPVFNKLIYKKNENEFEKLLLKILKRFLTPQTNKYFNANLSIKFEDNEIIIKNNCNENTLELNKYHIERAIVDSYIAILSNDNKNANESDYKIEEAVIFVLNYLNDKANTEFEPTKQIVDLISELIKKHSVTAINTVIDNKTAEWKNTPMQVYLRPSTLFNLDNFQNYHNGLNLPPNIEQQFKNQQSTKTVDLKLEII